MKHKNKKYDRQKRIKLLLRQRWAQSQSRKGNRWTKPRTAAARLKNFSAISKGDTDSKVIKCADTVLKGT